MALSPEARRKIAIMLAEKAKMAGGNTPIEVKKVQPITPVKASMPSVKSISGMEPTKSPFSALKKKFEKKNA